jgi:hypothetical protein
MALRRRFADKESGWVTLHCERAHDGATYPAIGWIEYPLNDSVASLRSAVISVTFTDDIVYRLSGYLS